MRYYPPTTLKIIGVVITVLIKEELGSMVTINENYLKLSGGYLFTEIGRRVAKFKAENPETSVISLGIGDVTRPLPPTAIKSLHQAVDEMAQPETFRGYGPEQGYDFLINKII